STPLIEEPGKKGMPVAFIRAIGRSMTSAAWPVPAWSGERAWRRNGRVFISAALLAVGVRLQIIRVQSGNPSQGRAALLPASETSVSDEKAQAEVSAPRCSGGCGRSGGTAAPGDPRHPDRLAAQQQEQPRSRA